MNVLLFSSEQLKGSLLTITDQRQNAHLTKILKATVGHRIRVGQLHGALGYGTIIQQSEASTQLEIELSIPAPEPLPLKLLLALPRPKMLRRILQICATLGVHEIVLLNSAKVDKSYWQTPLLQPQSVQDNLLLGLEQGGLTHLPKVAMAKLFKPFVEDQLAHWAGNTRCLIAHPLSVSATEQNTKPCYIAPLPNSQPTTLALGPEGGFSSYEVRKITEQGFTRISLGERILRVETAIPVAIAQLMKL